MAARSLSQSKKHNQTEVKQDSLTLGQHLSAVLNSPNLPVGLHTGIWDCLGDIPTADLMDEPEFLDKLLKLGQEIEAKPKDGDSEAEEKSQTVTITRYQFEQMEERTFALLALAAMLEGNAERDKPWGAD